MTFDDLGDINLLIYLCIYYIYSVLVYSFILSYPLFSYISNTQRLYFYIIIV